MAGQCRKSPFCACAACALDREGGYMVVIRTGAFWPKPKSIQKPSTKFCRKCGSTHLIEMRSLERKRCANCRRLIYWPLTEGQKPLL